VTIRPQEKAPASRGFFIGWDRNKAIPLTQRRSLEGHRSG
jgi:hypothetical protein